MFFYYPWQFIHSYFLFPCFLFNNTPRSARAVSRELNVVYAKALNRWPYLWCKPVEHWEDRLAILREMNLEVSRIITLYPAFFSNPPHTLRAKVEALSRIGLDSAKVVRRCPTVFCYSENRIRGILSFLDDVGLDGVRAVNAAPNILGCSVEKKLRLIVHFVTVEMGRAHGIGSSEFRAKSEG